MGKVFLVGAGPGDPELLTVKAVRLLQSADVVLHDALVSAEVLALISPRAKIMDVGKRCGPKLLTQGDINALLISLGAEANIVVRLKVGDPLIFGRAGEELEALANAGIAVEIVPGITAALSGAAVAKVSLTDRRFASSVLFTTAHRRPGGGKVQWKKLVRPDCTLVIYMPGQDHAMVARDLRAAGLAPKIACAVISSASCPTQQILWTDLASLSRGKTLPAPSVLIVGDCARVLPQLLPTDNLFATNDGTNAFMTAAPIAERDTDVR